MHLLFEENVHENGLLFMFQFLYWKRISLDLEKKPFYAKFLIIDLLPEEPFLDRIFTGRDSPLYLV